MHRKVAPHYLGTQLGKLRYRKSRSTVHNSRMHYNKKSKSINLLANIFVHVEPVNIYVQYRRKKSNNVQEMFSKRHQSGVPI